MKRKNLFVILGGVLVLVVIALILFGVFGGLSIIPLPIQTKIVSWMGTPVILSSVSFGTMTNTRSTPFYGNDGDVTINNGYSIGASRLILSSSVNAYKREVDTNFIDVEIELPAGELKVKCVASAQDDNWEQATATCSIKEGLYTLFILKVKPGYRGVSNTRIKEEVIILEEPKKITAMATSSGTPGVNAVAKSSATLTLDFEEKKVIEPPPTPPTPSIGEWIANIWNSIIDWFRGLFS